MTVQAPPPSPRRLSSSDSDMSTPTLSKAPRRSFLSRVPSLLMSINLKQSLYIWSCSSEKPPSFWPLPMLLVLSCYCRNKYESPRRSLPHSGPCPCCLCCLVTAGTNMSLLGEASLILALAHVACVVLLLQEQI